MLKLRSWDFFFFKFLIWQPCIGWFEGRKKEPERLNGVRMGGGWRNVKKGVSGCMMGWMDRWNGQTPEILRR